MLYLTDQNFESEIQKANKPVLVDFWAFWCLPCFILSPILEKLEKEFKERIKRRIQFLEETIKNSEIDIPQIMIEKTLDQMIKSNNKELREQWREKAKNNVASNLTLYKIAEIEKIEFDPQQGLDNEKVFQYLESLAG